MKRVGSRLPKEPGRQNKHRGQAEAKNRFKNMQEAFKATRTSRLRHKAQRQPGIWLVLENELLTQVRGGDEGQLS